MRCAIRALLLLGVLALAPAHAGDAERGRQVYDAYCTQCHGMDGSGGGLNVEDMDVMPRDHTDPDEMGARTDAELAKAIRGGGKAVNKSVLMPAWEGNLSDQQVDDLIAYLRRLCCNE